MADPTPSEPSTRSREEGSPTETDLAYVLSGRLPCTTCGYDLAGLSVLDRCPECGTLIRDSLLILVDPSGDSVPKVRSPRRVAIGIVGSAACAFLSVLSLIAHRASVLLCETHDVGCGLGVLAAAGVLLLGLSAVCAAGLVIPLRATSRSSTIAATLGSTCLLAAAVAAGFTLLSRDANRGSPYLTMDMPDIVRVGEHAAVHALALLAVVLLRLNARAISQTAWRVRENHDNRQRLLTVAASLAAVLVGDVLMLTAGAVDSVAGVAVGLCGELLVFASSGILAIALLGVLGDAVSIASTLWRMPVAFRDVVRRAPS